MNTASSAASPPIVVEAHPLLDVACFWSDWPRAIGALSSPPALLALFSREARAPLATDEAVRGAVRELLRVGGFKPTGRGKPASEYLWKAVDEGWFSPEKGINAAVDVCNAVSLHSGLPISVVDAARLEAPLRIGLLPKGTSYAFNPAGQVIDVGGLFGLCDALGPSAGPVKDAQRSKTHEETRRTLTIIWGTTALPGRTEAARSWYARLQEGLGATVEPARAAG